MTKLQACLWPSVTLKGCYVLLYSLLSTAELQDGKSIFDVFFFKLSEQQIRNTGAQVLGSRFQAVHVPDVRC